LWSDLVYGRDAGEDAGTGRQGMTKCIREGLVFRVFIKDGDALNTGVRNCESMIHVCRDLRFLI
jgi:hypothetical protein